MTTTAAAATKEVGRFLRALRERRERRWKAEPRKLRLAPRESSEERSSAQRRRNRVWGEQGEEIVDF